MINLFILYSLVMFSTLEPHCSCNPVTVADNFNRADVVVMGKVIAIDTIKFIYRAPVYVSPEGDTTFGYSKQYLIKMDVIKSYKGSTANDTIDVTTYIDGAGCGYYFEKDNNYVVYARRITEEYSKQGTNYKIYSRGDFLSTSLCDRTTGAIEHEEASIEKYLRTVRLEKQKK